MAGKYQIWSCKIYVDADAELPPGFDATPRNAAVQAIEKSGIDIVACSSGWGTVSTDEDEQDIEGLSGPDEIYIAGMTELLIGEEDELNNI